MLSRSLFFSLAPYVFLHAAHAVLEPEVPLLAPVRAPRVLDDPVALLVVPADGGHSVVRLGAAARVDHARRVANEVAGRGARRGEGLDRFKSTGSALGENVTR